MESGSTALINIKIIHQMKSLAFLVIASVAMTFAACTGCGGKGDVAADSVQADSVVDSVVVDTVLVDSVAVDTVVVD